MIAFDKGQFDMICLPKAAAEALLGAPSVCLKLYIYGLMRGESDLLKMSEELNVSSSELEEALQLLKEKGLIASRGEKLIYLMPEHEEEISEAVYSDKENVAILQALFSDRVLSSRDYVGLRECTTVYGLPAGVVNILVEHCILTSRAGNRVSIAFIQKKAAEWAEEGINTIELAERRSALEKSDSQNLKELLLRLGIRGRHASNEEKKLFNKWTSKYLMDIDAIYAALPATLSAQNPSMIYLDRILESMYSEGRTTAAQISDKINDSDRVNEGVKKLLEAIGAPRRTVTEDMRKMYRRFMSMGFTEEVILFAGKRAAMEGFANLKNVDVILSGWASRGATTLKAVNDLLDSADIAKARAQAYLNAMGISRAAGDRDIATVNKYIAKGMNEDTVLYAAKLAYGAASPQKLAETILKNWSELGIKTMEEAEQENEKHRISSKKKSGGTTNEREYDEEEFFSRLRDPLADL